MPKKEVMIFPAGRLLIPISIPMENKNGRVYIKVKDIASNPRELYENLSAYLCSFDYDKDFVYHFSQVICTKPEFKNHKCLCIHKGKVDWHTRGNCKHTNYSKREEED